jgi:hypothetical protein
MTEFRSDYITFTLISLLYTPCFPRMQMYNNLFFYCCTVHLDNIKITFTNGCTIH